LFLAIYTRVTVCGRYTNTASPSLLADHFGLLDVPDAVTRRFNVAPTDEVTIAVPEPAGLAPRTVRWGLIPHWSKDRKGAARMINARSEDVTRRSAYRELVKSPRGRCLVLADGYYEWLRAEDPREPRVPMWFGLPDQRPFAFAGLWTTWRSPDGDVIPSATILTTAANAVVAPIHDRMPVMLVDSDGWRRWLDPALDDAELAALTQPIDAGLLSVVPANPLVNSVANDGPELLRAPAAAGT
jgi:putative SOS response-associated peptidase YedK